MTADRWGNVVAYTNTIEQFAGTGMTVPGYGFLLNNEMTDFDFAPSSPDVPDVNLPAAGKRPRSSMNPTIVLRHGRPDFAVGSPGGATIITTVTQILINHIDFGMSLEQAIAAPRVGNFNTPTSPAGAGVRGPAGRPDAGGHLRPAVLRRQRRHAARQRDRRRDRHPAAPAPPVPGGRGAGTPRRWHRAGRAVNPG